MNVPRLAKAYFKLLNERIGPFDQPFQFHVFPFQEGGALNFMTVGAGEEKFVTYVSWDLFGHPEQKRGALGRFELAAECNDEAWCANILTSIGRQTLTELVKPGDTLDIGPWAGPDASLQGVFFEELLRARLQNGLQSEICGVLRCIGITREELQFAKNQGVPMLVGRLRLAGIYPRTQIQRQTVPLC